MLKDRRAEPQRTDEAMAYLGYTITRAGVRPGPKARARLPARVRRALRSGDVARVQSSVASYAAVWRFGP